MPIFATTRDNVMYSKLFKEHDYKVDWKFVESIPEFAALKNCEQNPKWHGEGNAWIHTKKCVEAAYDLVLEPRYEALNPRIAIAAVLFHDIGKGVTTEFVKGAWHAYGHEFAGEKIARRLLWDEVLSIREIICACARYHMKVLNLASSKRIVDDMIKMSKIAFTHFRYLLFVKECDVLGSRPMDEGQTTADLERLGAIYKIANRLDILDREFFVPEIDNDIIFNPSKPINWYGLGKNVPTVRMLIGLPGAGKNTWCEDRHDMVMLSRDDIRAELGYCKEGEKVVLSGEKEDRVTEVFNSRFINAVKEGKDVILNNLNIKKKYRDALKVVVNGYSVRWVYIYIEAPSIEDNIKRRPTFDPDQLRGMTEVLEWPQPDEYDEMFYVKGMQS